MPGWDGPYLEGFSGIHPWGGTYQFEGAVQWDSNPMRELVVDFDNWKFPDGPNDNKYRIPDAALKKIDEVLDDGDTGTGDLRRIDNQDSGWVVEWNVLAPPP